MSQHLTGCPADSHPEPGICACDQITADAQAPPAEEPGNSYGHFEENR
ncbi:hypothetical protein OG596_26395 [Streptomyces sp. NBC_01102]|nr:hypothetical protein OG596_26395 [Streptomyces sp. NBC_01102]